MESIVVKTARIQFSEEIVRAVEQTMIVVDYASRDYLSRDHALATIIAIERAQLDVLRASSQDITPDDIRNVMSEAISDVIREVLYAAIDGLDVFDVAKRGYDAVAANI